MQLTTYLLGSMYVMNSIFRFSNYMTNYLFNNNIIDLPITKFDKINESIYSSIHGVLVSFMAMISMNNVYENTNLESLQNNRLQFITASLCFSYFMFDILQCLYNQKYLFILHHLAALQLLTLTLYSFYNNENDGYYSMQLIFLLESNTILLNIGFLLKELKFHYSITCTSWIIHLILFVLFRLITLPKIVFIYYYNKGMTISTLSRLPSIILILSGSFYWAYRQTIGIKKYLKENSVL